ncbi:MAG TPA: response regulator transcription factor [Gallionella sp.]|nr:response regulator transcription factor [Gallionella sp.]
MIRVLLADDHVLLRAGLKNLLSLSGDIAVTGEAATGAEVLQKLKEDTFDLILLDVTMPGLSGAALIAKIREDASNPPILVLTMHAEAQIAMRKVSAGAAGYITKDCPPGMVEEAVRKVAAGGVYIVPEMAEKMIFRSHQAATAHPHEHLSTQELRILKLLAQEMRLVDIAKETRLNSRTVSTYKARIMQKLELENEAALLRYIDTHINV